MFLKLRVLKIFCLTVILSSATAWSYGLGLTENYPESNQSSLVDHPGSSISQPGALPNFQNICFHDYISYQQVRGKLPYALQNNPLYAVHQGWDFTGIFRIVPSNGRLLIQAKAASAVGGYSVDAYIVSACLEGDEMQVSLDNGEDELISIQGNSLTIKGRDFRVTDAGTYQQVANQINQGLN